jgi:Xaa-Pro aminopeptidase
MPTTVAERRADIDAKQAAIVPMLAALNVDAMLFFVPAHIAWFTAGMHVPGLIPDTERPLIYTNGQQRWVICSNMDTQRLFDEELDGLGFQVKEWHWESGRTELLLYHLEDVKLAADRAFGQVQLVNEHLRPLLRVLSALEQKQYRELGKFVAHAVEATARHCSQGQTEQEIAGHMTHRLWHHGIEPVSISVAAEGRSERYRRLGCGPTPVTRTAVLQATGQRDGLFATCSRTVSFGAIPEDFAVAHDLAVKQAASFRSWSKPNTTIGDIGVAGRAILANTPYEHDHRLSSPGFGTGRFPAEFLGRPGAEEPLAAGVAVVWQPRVGPAAVVDTLLVSDSEPLAITPPEDWPVKRIIVRGHPAQEIADVLVR